MTDQLQTSDASQRDMRYQATLDALLRAAPHGSARDLFAHVGDDFWFWLHTEGSRRDPRLRSVLAGLPPEEFQRNLTGTAGDQALRLGFDFYRLVHGLMRSHGTRAVDSILDFGCGWGRIQRFFMRDVAAERLLGIDCLPEAIAVCRATNPHSRFDVVRPLPPTRLAADSFDLVYAYSVFSHLSEPVHLAWLGEFQRILRPGGVLIVTTRPRDFILYCAHLRTLSDLPTWASAAKAFGDVEACVARYDRGEFLYDPHGAGLILDSSRFGEAAIPRAYVERVWTQTFELLDYVADPQICEQNVIAARKRGTA